VTVYIAIQLKQATRGIAQHGGNA